MIDQVQYSIDVIRDPYPFAQGLLHDHHLKNNMQFSLPCAMLQDELVAILATDVK